DDYMRSGKYVQARASYDRARTLAPDSSSPLCRLYLSYVLTGDMAQAGAALKQAMNRAQTANDIRLNIADVSPTSDDLKNVTRFITQQAGRADANAGEHGALAYLLWVQNDRDIAMLEAQRAAEMAPEAPEIQKLFALLKAEQSGPATQPLGS